MLCTLRQSHCIFQGKEISCTDQKKKMKEKKKPDKITVISPR